MSAIFTSKLGQQWPRAEIEAQDKAAHQKLRRLTRLPHNKHCPECGQSPTCAQMLPGSAVVDAGVLQVLGQCDAWSVCVHELQPDPQEPRGAYKQSEIVHGDVLVGS